MMKRKDFIRSASALAASGLFFRANAMSPLRNETIKVGLIGVKGMGWSDLMALLKQPNVQCTALCDVDERILDQRISELKKQQIEVKRFINYKELLKGDVVDTVVIGTPDHWHCLQMVDARSEEHTSELQSRFDLVCRLLLEK